MRKALVVDDDETNRRLISAILQRERFLVTWASDGAEAITSLSRNDFSVIVLDLLMPEVNGQEVIRYLRGAKPELLGRVIVLSALSEIDVPRDLVFTVLRKPFEFEKFLSVICACADQDGMPGDIALRASPGDLQL